MKDFDHKKLDYFKEDLRGFSSKFKPSKGGFLMSVLLDSFIKIWVISIL